MGEAYTTNPYKIGSANYNKVQTQINRNKPEWSATPDKGTIKNVYIIKFNMLLFKIIFYYFTIRTIIVSE